MDKLSSRWAAERRSARICSAPRSKACTWIRAISPVLFKEMRLGLRSNSSTPSSVSNFFRAALMAGCVPCSCSAAFVREPVSAMTRNASSWEKSIMHPLSHKETFMLHHDLKVYKHPPLSYTGRHRGSRFSAFPFSIAHILVYGNRRNHSWNLSHCETGLPCP